MATTSAVDDRPGSVSVLVLDDRPTDAWYLAEALALADDGVRARSEHDPDDAIATIADGRIDCLVIDADLASVETFAFLDRVAATDADVRAIVHTAEDDPEIAREAWDRGAAYVRKGPDFDRYDVLARHITRRTEAP